MSTRDTELERWIEGEPFPDEERDPDPDAGAGHLSTLEYLRRVHHKREPLTREENDSLFKRWQVEHEPEVGDRLYGACLNLTLKFIFGAGVRAEGDEGPFQDALSVTDLIFGEALAVWNGGMFPVLYKRMLTQRFASRFAARKNVLSIASPENNPKETTEESRERYLRGRVKRVVDFDREDERLYLLTGQRGVPVDPEHAAIEAAMNGGESFLRLAYDEGGTEEMIETTGRDPVDCYYKRQAIEEAAAERVDAQRRQRVLKTPERISDDPRDLLIEAIARLPQEEDRTIMTEVLAGYSRDEDDAQIVKNLAEHLTRSTGEEWSAERVRQRRKRIQDLLKSQL